MDKDQLKQVLDKHLAWLRGESGGKRADLTGAYLRRADLTGADLTGADLTGADLTGAYLRGADLTSADLTGANLRDANLTDANLTDANLRDANLTGAYLRGANTAKTILENLNWLTYIGITPNERGYAYAYKLINSYGEGPFNGGINYLEAKSFAVAGVDLDVHTHCSYGINLATFQWCLGNKQDGYRVLLMRFHVDDAICPVGSDGKFRVRKCTRVGECDWQGNRVRS